MSSLITKLVWYSLLAAELVVAPTELLESVRVCLEASEFRELFHLFPKLYNNPKPRVFSFAGIGFQHQNTVPSLFGLPKYALVSQRSAVDYYERFNACAGG